ncbi:MAG: molybdopterin molybdotransferase MoeA [Promethearchaeota archaeon]
MKFLKTIRVEEFRNILNSIKNLSLKEEIISLDESYNRVTSQDIISPIDVPHFRKSKMDGYAIIAEDSFGAEEDNLIALELIETIQAGDIPKKKVDRGFCSSIATGAPVPEGADGIIMVEYTEKQGTKVFISKSITPGTDIINIGHDIKKGEIIVKKDSLIDLATLGIFASCGIKEIPVQKKVLVSLMSTGNELVDHNVKYLEIGKIYDVNSIVLRNAIEKSGAKVIFYGRIHDNFKELKKKINAALEKSDIVILSGGTSKGEGDLGPAVLQTYDNIDILVHGVRIKPGKPLIFAKMGKKIIFILPGYPTSALSCFYVFIENFIRRMSSFPLKENYSKELEVGERIYSTVGRHEFKAVKLQEVNKVKKIFPIKTGSEAISTMFYADGYIEIDELEAIIEKGDKKVFFPF